MRMSDANIAHTYDEIILSYSCKDLIPSIKPVIKNVGLSNDTKNHRQFKHFRICVYIKLKILCFLGIFKLEFNIRIHSIKKCLK